MVFSCEKEFVKRSYYEYKDNHANPEVKQLFAYCKKYNETAMITLDYEEALNKWYFSYPMKNQGINYKVSFYNKDKLKNYIYSLLDQDLLE
jgi:hypothetical protein